MPAKSTNAAYNNVNRYKDAIKQIASKVGIPACTLWAIVYSESSGQPVCTDRKGPLKYLFPGGGGDQWYYNTYGPPGCTTYGLTQVSMPSAVECGLPKSTNRDAYKVLFDSRTDASNINLLYGAKYYKKQVDIARHRGCPDIYSSGYWAYNMGAKDLTASTPIYKNQAVNKWASAYALGKRVYDELSQEDVKPIVSIERISSPSDNITYGKPLAPDIIPVPPPDEANPWEIKTPEIQRGYIKNSTCYSNVEELPVSAAAAYTSENSTTPDAPIQMSNLIDSAINPRFQSSLFSEGGSVGTSTVYQTPANYVDLKNSGAPATTTVKNNRNDGWPTFFESYEDAKATITIKSGPSQQETLLETSNFLLTSAPIQKEENLQVIEGFGENEVTSIFFGQKAQTRTFRGVLLDTQNSAWKGEFLEIYHSKMRGTQLLKSKARVYVLYKNIVVEGYAINAVIAEDSNNPDMVEFSFTLLITNEAFLDSDLASTFPWKPGIVTGLTKNQLMEDWAKSIQKTGLPSSVQRKLATEPEMGTGAVFNVQDPPDKFQATIEDPYNYPATDLQMAKLTGEAFQWQMYCQLYSTFGRIPPGEIKRNKTMPYFYQQYETRLANPLAEFRAESTTPGIKFASSETNPIGSGQLVRRIPKECGPGGTPETKPRVGLKGQYAIKGANLKGIIMHQTEYTPPTPPENVCKDWESRIKEKHYMLGAHFIVCPNSGSDSSGYGIAHNCIYMSDVGIHTPGFNTGFVGIEMQARSTGTPQPGAIYPATWEQAKSNGVWKASARLAGCIKFMYQVPQLTTHKESGKNHNDPNWTKEQRNEFFNLVNEEFNICKKIFESKWAKILRENYKYVDSNVYADSKKAKEAADARNKIEKEKRSLEEQKKRELAARKKSIPNKFLRAIASGSEVEGSM